MMKLFWGFALVLLDFSWELGSASIEVLPDFLGYLLLMRGMEPLLEERFFARGRHVAFGLMLLSIVLWIAALTDPDTGTAIAVWGGTLIAKIAGLFLLYGTVREICRLERENQWDLQGDRLKGMVPIVVLMLPVCKLLEWIPIVGRIGLAAGTVISFCFLAAFWNTSRRFQNRT